MSLKSLISFTLILLFTHLAIAEQLQDFSSDGCSHFPDGTLAQPTLWCDCCITHDIAYWQGGSSQLKKQADEALRQCILQKTSNSLLADTMYVGVSVGGLPVFPIWYRWGYGWNYGRGFKKLNQYGKQQVQEKLQHHSLSISQSSCDFDHPLKKMIEEEVQDFYLRFINHAISKIN